MSNNVSTYGNETPIGWPDVGARAGVFAPVAGREKDIPNTIKNGAGIVGFGNPDGTLTIYFESNRFDEPKLQKWEGKVRQAYDKMVNHAPTTSHTIINAELLQQIGIANSAGITIRNEQGLLRWLAHCNVTTSAPEQTTIAWRS